VSTLWQGCLCHRLVLHSLAGLFNKQDRPALLGTSVPKATPKEQKVASARASTFPSVKNASRFRTCKLSAGHSPLDLSGYYEKCCTSMVETLRLPSVSDHSGLDLKNQLLGYLQSRGYFVQDCGTHSKDAVDYPRIAYTVARLVAGGVCDRGIMVDGAGIGSAWPPTKSVARAPRRATVWPSRRTRASTTTQCAHARAGQTDLEAAKKIVDTFLACECVEERHRKRVQLINAIQEGPIETEHTKRRCWPRWETRV